MVKTDGFLDGTEKFEPEVNPGASSNVTGARYRLAAKKYSTSFISCIMGEC